MAKLSSSEVKTLRRLPVIQRDADACLLSLSHALEALSGLCEPESSEADEQLNLLKRSKLAGLFAVLHDYAEAVRGAMPDYNVATGEWSEK